MSLIDALIIYFVDPVLLLILILVFVGVILSWLISFNVVNAYNPLVSTIWRITNTVTEPILAPIRRILPPLGGMDFSPLILLLLIQFIRGYVLPQIMFNF